MSKLFINIIGHNASGKTTLAKKLENDLSANRINGDDFRNYIKNNIRYFNDLDDSYKNHKFDALNPLVISMRLSLTKLLLENNQSVLYEGSGFKKIWRQKYLDIARQCGAKTVIIVTQTDEDTLMKRLRQRDKGEWWVKQYFDHKKTSFEEPGTDEADLVTTYNQTNYESVLQEIQNLADYQPNSL